ncbi:MAG: phosphotransferase [Caldilineaceae bacterium]
MTAQRQPRQPALPPCRWQPWQKVIGWYTNLAQVADDVPTELAALCQFSLNILAQVGQWSAMPNTLLHGDPNHVNAVCTGIADRTAPNSLVLIDWDNAGLGPPILDLGYLLLTAMRRCLPGPRSMPMMR